MFSTLSMYILLKGTVSVYQTNQKVTEMDEDCIPNQPFINPKKLLRSQIGQCTDILGQLWVTSYLKFIILIWPRGGGVRNHWVVEELCSANATFHLFCSLLFCFVLFCSLIFRVYFCSVCFLLNSRCRVDVWRSSIAEHQTLLRMFGHCRWVIWHHRGDQTSLSTPSSKPTSDIRWTRRSSLSGSVVSSRPAQPT